MFVYNTILNNVDANIRRRFKWYEQDIFRSQVFYYLFRWYSFKTYSTTDRPPIFYQRLLLFSSTCLSVFLSRLWFQASCKRLAAHRLCITDHWNISSSDDSLRGLVRGPSPHRSYWTIGLWSLPILSSVGSNLPLYKSAS